MTVTRRIAQTFGNLLNDLQERHDIVWNTLDDIKIEMYSIKQNSIIYNFI